MKYYYKIYFTDSAYDDFSDNKTDFYDVAYTTTPKSRLPDDSVYIRYVYSTDADMEVDTGEDEYENGRRFKRYAKRISKRELFLVLI